MTNWTVAFYIRYHFQTVSGVGPHGVHYSSLTEMSLGHRPLLPDQTDYLLLFSFEVKKSLSAWNTQKIHKNFKIKKFAVVCCSHLESVPSLIFYVNLTSHVFHHVGELLFRPLGCTLWGVASLFSLVLYVYLKSCSLYGAVLKQIQKFTLMQNRCSYFNWIKTVVPKHFHLAASLTYWAISYSSTLGLQSYMLYRVAGFSEGFHIFPGRFPQLPR